MFYLLTFILNVLVINSKAKISSGYFSDRSYTWEAAKDRCKMVGLLDKIQVPDSERQLGWVDASAEYSPWVEYQNCLYVKPKFIDKHTRVTYGVQLQQCLHFCEDYYYIGLQQNNCSCLSLSKLSNTTAESACNQKETCRGDKYAYCSYHLNDSTSQNNFVVYKKVNVSRQYRIGNCLSVTISQGQKNFKANPCETKFKPLCTGQNSRLIYKNYLANDWATSFKKCSSYGFVAYDIIKQSNNLTRGNFWLGSLRRPMIHRSAEADPEYCIAVIIRPDDFQVNRYIRPCTDKLPAICACVTDMTSSNTITCNTPPGFETEEPRNKSIVLIAVMSTAVVAVALIVAVIVLYVRKTSFRSARHPTLASSNEVIYENTSNDATINQTTDNTFDQMHYQSLSQNRIPIESNYTPLQSAGIDVTRTTDTQRHNVIDESVEHYLVDEDYQEIEDVLT